MRGRTGYRRMRRLGVAMVGVVVVGLTVFGGTASSAPRATTELRLLTLPIANALPLDLGVQKGFFSQQGITFKKTTLQSGNDVVLAMGNNNGDIAYAGFVPMMIGSTSGIPLQLLASSEVEGTSVSDNWQNILVKGSSSIHTPQDLRGKTVAVNALKGVGEIMIRAAFEKLGMSSSAARLTAIPFPQMRSALNNGQVDAVWTPEPFLSQILSDGGRSVMAPGPVLGRYFPIGGYAAKPSWISANKGLAQRFRTAMNRSLVYAQSHPDEIRALLAPAIRNIRLPIWSPLIDRSKLQQLANYSRKYDVISKLPNMKQLVPNSIASGLALQGTVQGRRVLLRLDGRTVKKLAVGPYVFVVTDNSRTQNFVLKGPRINRKTSVKGRGRITWTVNLRKGTYRYWSSAQPRAKKSFTVG
ncbi:MAG TPA: ABC transporter substrate-binding protein [Gaiellaceae bacterium]|nr:ABC transporter substrate-binding protein [Gaiellaceae bacterium]